MSSLKLNEQQQEWLIKGLSGVVVFAVCLRFMILPFFWDMVLYKQRAVEDQKRLGLFQEMHVLSKKVSSMEASLATLADRSLMLGKISDIATKHHIDIQNLAPKSSKEGAYINLKIDMNATGNFLALLNFLRAVEALEPPMIARDLTLSSVRSKGRSAEIGKGGEALHIRLVLGSYLKQPQEKKKS
jgi:hypothetical protein